MSEQEKTARDREAARDPAPPRFPHSSGPASSRIGEPPTSSSSSTASTPQPTLSSAPPHHHHHHHHHHHTMSHSSGAGGGNDRGGSDRPAGPAGSSSAHESRVPGSGLSSAYPTLSSNSANASQPGGAPRLLGSNPSQSPYSFGHYFSEKRERDRIRQMERDRERERERRDPAPSQQQQQQSKPSGPDTSPGRPSSTQPYPGRSLLSTSPTLSNRPNPGAPPGSSGSSKPPSAMLPSSSASSRPGVRLPSFSSLSGRPLGAPFDSPSGRARSGSTSSAGTAGGDKPPPSGHQRNLSASSNPRESLSGMSSMGQTSPVKSNAPAPPPGASRNIFAAPPPLPTTMRESSAQRSPVQSTSSVTTSPQQQPREPPSSAAGGAAAPGASGGGAKPAGSSSSTATSHASRPPYSFSSAYASAYTQPYSSYGLGSGFLGSGSGYPFSYSAQERERREREAREREKERERERDRDREREQRERDNAERNRRERELERERAATAQRERERKLEAERDERHRQERLREEMRVTAEREKERERERRAAFGVQTKPFQPPRQESTTYGDMYRPRQGGPGAAAQEPSFNEPKYTRHIEVINRPSDRPVDHPVATPPGPAPAAAPSTSQQPLGAGPRERPYSYKPQEARDYQYASRDTKRPRMDVAIEEQAAQAQAQQAAQQAQSQAAAAQAQAQAPPPVPAPAPAQPSRRTAAGGSRAKKRKEEEKKTPPQRDWSQLTTAVKKWPEVSSVPIETWLKGRADDVTKRIVGYDVYRGSNWSLAKTRLTDEECLGGVVVVRISGAFLGSKWKVRGEPGWDEASVTGSDDAVVGLGWAPGGAAQRDRKIWGTDVYTDDSDLGLVLIHAGWIRWGGSPKRDDNDAINVSIRVVPTLVHYTATERNGLVTRGWGNSHDGASIVIEGVERVKTDKTYNARLPRRTQRKLAITERALQYAAMLQYAPAPWDVESAAGVLDEDRVEEPKPKFWPDALHNDLSVVRGLVFSRYRPDSLASYLDPPADDNEFPSLWTHDLHFGSASERYCLRMSTNAQGSPRLLVTMSEGDVNPGKLFGEGSRIAEDVDPRSVHWMDEGLAIQLDDDEGILCRADVHAWKRRDEPLAPSYLDDDDYDESPSKEQANGANGVNGDDGKPAEKDAMDVDEPEPEPAAEPAASAPAPAPAVPVA